MPSKKYLVSSGVFERHYRPEFMKHVLPRFERPTQPLRDLGSIISSIFFLASFSTEMELPTPSDSATDVVSTVD